MFKIIRIILLPNVGHRWRKVEVIWWVRCDADLYWSRPLVNQLVKTHLYKQTVKKFVHNMKCVTVYLKHLVRLEVSVSENDAMVEVVDGVRTVSSSASVDDSCMLATLGVEQQLWLLWPCCGLWLWLCNPLLLLLLLLLLTSCILCVLILRDCDHKKFNHN